MQLAAIDVSSRGEKQAKRVIEFTGCYCNFLFPLLFESKLLAINIFVLFQDHIKILAEFNFLKVIVLPTMGNVY